MHLTVLGRYHRALDQGQEIALHTFAAHIGPGPVLGSRNLVDFVQEHDAVLFDRLDRRAVQFIVIDQAVAFFLDQDVMALGHAHATLLLDIAERLAEEFAEVDHADVGSRHAGQFERWQAAGALADFDFNFLLIKLTGPKLLAHLLAGVTGGRRPGKHIEDALLGRRFGPGCDLMLQPRPRDHDGAFNQITDDRLDITADVSHLRELRRFHLDERGLRQLRKAPRDFGLADTGRPHHQDVLGQDFVA